MIMKYPKMVQEYERASECACTPSRDVTFNCRVTYARVKRRFTEARLRFEINSVELTVSNLEFEPYGFKLTVRNGCYSLYYGYCGLLTVIIRLRLQLLHILPVVYVAYMVDFRRSTCSRHSHVTFPTVVTVSIVCSLILFVLINCW